MRTNSLKFSMFLKLWFASCTCRSYKIRCDSAKSSGEILFLIFVFSKYIRRVTNTTRVDDIIEFIYVRCVYNTHRLSNKKIYIAV